MPSSIEPVLFIITISGMRDRGDQRADRNVDLAGNHHDADADARDHRQ